MMMSQIYYSKLILMTETIKCSHVKEFKIVFRVFTELVFPDQSIECHARNLPLKEGEPKTKWLPSALIVTITSSFEV